MECSRYTDQRKKLFDRVRPVLLDLDSDLSTKSLLGFFDFLSTRGKERSTRDMRRKLLFHTLDFIADTGRFDTE